MICCICEKPILDAYYSDYWGNTSHIEHLGKKPFFCNSCGRIIGKLSTLGRKKQMGFKMKDDRIICGICEESSIKNQKQIDTSFKFVLALLKKIHVFNNAENISISIEDKIKLSKRASNKPVEGLCCSKILNVNNNTKVLSDIYILSGLPKIQFESVLCHEVLHHWLNTNEIKQGIFDEGFCNIGEALVLNYYIATKDDKLAYYLRERANKNPDFYYGLQFLKLKSKLKNNGWKIFINEIINRKEIKL